MITSLPRRVSTYNNGQPYQPARGRYAPRERVEDRFAMAHPVIDLQCHELTDTRFIQEIVREFKIRFYQPKTIKSYRNALKGFLRFLRWYS